MAPKKDQQFLQELKNIKAEAAEILKNVKPQTFNYPSGPRELKVWPGTTKEYAALVQRYIKANEGLGVRTPRRGAEQLGVVLKGDWPAKISGGLKHQDRGVSFTKQELDKPTRRSSGLKQWNQAGRSLTIDEQKYWERLREKPHVKALDKFIKKGDIHKHHILIAELLQPFATIGKDAVGNDIYRSQEELQTLIKGLAKKGWFVGDHNKNLVWLAEDAHLTDELAVHRVLRKLYDIQGRPAGEVEIPKLGGGVKTYDPKAMHGFSNEHIKYLQNAPIEEVNEALGLYVDTVGGQLRGAVDVAMKRTLHETSESADEMSWLARQLDGTGNEVFQNFVKNVGKTTIGAGTLTALNQMSTLAQPVVKIASNIPGVEYATYGLWKGFDVMVADWDHKDAEAARDAFAADPTKETLLELRYRNEMADLSKMEIGDPTNISALYGIPHWLLGKQEWYRKAVDKYKTHVDPVVDTVVDKGREVIEPFTTGQPMSLLGSMPNIYEQSGKEAVETSNQSSELFNPGEGKENIEERDENFVKNF